MENQTSEEHITKHYPSLLTRLKCTLTDAIIVIILMIVATQVLESFTNPPVWTRILALSLIVLYEPILVAYGRTVGQMVMGIKIVQFKDFQEEGKEKRINILASIFRYAIKLALGWISLLTVTSNEHKKAIHDGISDSVMILA